MKILQKSLAQVLRYCRAAQSKLRCTHTQTLLRNRKKQEETGERRRLLSPLSCLYDSLLIRPPSHFMNIWNTLITKNKNNDKIKICAIKETLGLTDYKFSSISIGHKLSARHLMLVSVTQPGNTICYVLSLTAQKLSG